VQGLRYLKKGGFTLIELLVVIVIIGILVAIAFANYVDLTQKACDAVAAGVLSAERDAYTLYYIQNKTYPVNFSDTNNLVQVAGVTVYDSGLIKVKGILGLSRNYQLSITSSGVSCTSPSECTRW